MFNIMVVIRNKKTWAGFVAQRFHNYMILKVLIVFDPKLNLFKSDAYIFMQQSHLGTNPGLKFKKQINISVINSFFYVIPK